MNSSCAIFMVPAIRMLVMRRKKERRRRMIYIPFNSSKKQKAHRVLACGLFLEPSKLSETSTGPNLVSYMTVSECDF